jgi:threonine/homoserine/homoserine lactone efflux protein
MGQLVFALLLVGPGLVVLVAVGLRRGDWRAALGAGVAAAAAFWALYYALFFAAWLLLPSPDPNGTDIAPAAYVACTALAVAGAILFGLWLGRRDTR